MTLQNQNGSETMALNFGERIWRIPNNQMLLISRDTIELATIIDANLQSLGLESSRLATGTVNRIFCFCKMVTFRWAQAVLREHIVMELNCLLCRLGIDCKIIVTGLPTAE
jgi:hypothetical protein